jgi:hypothetical protein
MNLPQTGGCLIFYGGATVPPRLLLLDDETIE